MAIEVTWLERMEGCYGGSRATVEDDDGTSPKASASRAESELRGATRVGADMTSRAPDLTPPRSRPQIDIQKGRRNEDRVSPNSVALPAAAAKMAGHLGTAAINAAGVALGEVFVRKAGAHLFGTAGGSAVSQAAANALTSASTLLLKSLTDTLTQLRISDAEALRATFQKTSARIATGHLDEYPEDIQNAALQILESIKLDLESSSPEIQPIRRQLRHLDEVILARPIRALDLDHRTNPKERQRIDRLLQHLRTSFPEHIRNKIEVLGEQIMTNSVAMSPSRVQAYFHGPAGVGKTYLVEELARAIGAPLVHVRIPPDFDGMKELLGSHSAPAEFTPISEPDSKIIGELPQRLIMAGFTNPIVFIDEFRATGDNVDELKKLLDPNRKLLKIGGYEAYLDWSRCTVILGSNERLDDEPLRTRMIEIKFDRATRDTKHAVASARIDSEASKHGPRTQDNPDAPLSQAQFDQVVEDCKGMLNQLIDFDEASCPGTRTLEMAAASLLTYAVCGMKGPSSRSEKELREYVGDLYRDIAPADDKDSRTDGSASDSDPGSESNIDDHLTSQISDDRKPG